MSRNRGIAILLATVASFASLPIELAVARPRIRINGPQPTRIPTNPPGRVPKQPPFSPVDLGDLIEKLSPSPDKTGRDNNTRHPSLCVDNLPEEEPHIQCPENSEQKKIIKEAIIIIAEALKEDIDRENKIVNSQLQNIESPVEQRLFLEQSHEILKGKIINKAKSLIERKYGNELSPDEVTFVAREAATVALKDSGIPENNVFQQSASL